MIIEKGGSRVQAKGRTSPPPPNPYKPHNPHRPQHNTPHATPHSREKRTSILFIHAREKKIRKRFAYRPSVMYTARAMTEEQLERLQRWIDTPKRELRIALAYNTDGTDTDALNETRGLTRGELIARYIDRYGL